jgi:UDP-GlcNAc:undecaprenyl-phosphate GlcNAc-1-phosphate transferase
VVQLADYFPTILVALCAAFISMPLLIRLALRIGLVDVPGSQAHKWHAASTPLAGGAAVAVALGISYLTIVPQLDREVAAVLLAGAIMFVWGVWDDLRTLPPWAKFAGQFLAALVLWFGGVKVSLFPFQTLNLGITLLWIVGMINAFNFVDSMDGLSLGLAAIAAGFFLLVTVDSQQAGLTALCAAVLGSTIGAFYFNASPARTFIGDSGSQLLGLLLAAIGMAYDPLGLPNAVSWFVPILVLGIPVFNMVLVVTSRLVRGLRVYQAHKDHVSHRLVHLGFDKTRTVLTLQLTAIVLGLVAFIALGGTPISANLLFGIVVLTGIAAVIFLERSYPRDESRTQTEGSQE